MFPLLEVTVAVMLVAFGLVLWTRGYQALNGDSEGTRAAVVSTLVGLGVGVLGLSLAWHRWQHEPVLLGFFLFLIAVGAFQLALAGQGVSDGYVRLPGEETSGIAATSLYPLLLMPSGEIISRDERPGRFWFWIVARAVVAVTLILFSSLAPTLTSIYRTVNH